MPNFELLLSKLAHAAEAYRPVQEAMEAGKIGRIADITPGVEAATKIERGFQEGRKAEEVMAALRPRDQAVGQFLRVAEPEHVSDFAREVDEAIRGGRQPDLGKIAVRRLGEMPIDRHGLDLNDLAPKVEMDHWFEQADGLPDVTVADVSAAVAPSEDAIKELDGVGSAWDGSVTPENVLQVAETERVAKQASEHGMGFTAETKLRDVYGPDNPLGQQMKADIDGTAAYIATGVDDHPVHGINITAADIQAHAAPSTVALDEIAKVGITPGFGKELVEALAEGNPIAEAHIAGDIQHSRDIIAKGINKVPRHPGAKKAVQAIEDERAALAAGGDGIVPPGASSVAEDMVPPGHGGGHVWLWNLARGAGANVIAPIRWIEHVLPKEIWQPVRLQSAKAWNTTHGFLDYIKPYVAGIKGPEAEHVGRLVDLNEKHFDMMRTKVEQAIARQATMGVHSTEEIDRLGKTLTWMHDQRAQMEVFDAALSDTQRLKLHAAAGAIRRSLDAAGWMLMQADHGQDLDRLIRSSGGSLKGLPMGAYFPHVFPQWDEAMKLGKSAVHLESPPEVRMFNRHLLPRVGYGGYSFDIHQSIEPYFQMLGRKMYVEPILKSIVPKAFLEASHKDYAWANRLSGNAPLPGGMSGAADMAVEKLNPRQTHILGEWLKAMLGVPTGADDMVRSQIQTLVRIAEDAAHPAPKGVVDALVGLGRKGRPALEAALGLTYRATQGALSFNFGFALKNLTQPIMGLAETDPLTWLAGMKMFYSKEGFNLTKDLSLSKEFERMMDITDSLAPFMVGHGSSSQVLARIDKAMMTLGSSTEFINRGLTAHVGIADQMGKMGFKTVREAMDAGKWDGILQHGVNFSEHINFVYGSLNMAPALSRNPASRLLTQFTSYPYMVGEIWAKWMKTQPMAFYQYMAITGHMNRLAWQVGTDTGAWSGFPGAANLRMGRDIPITQTPFYDLMTSMWQSINPNEDPAIKEYSWDKAVKSMLLYMVPAYVGINRGAATVEMLRTKQVVDRRGTPVREYKHPISDIAEVALGMRSRYATQSGGLDKEIRKLQYNRGKEVRDAAEDQFRINQQMLTAKGDRLVELEFQSNELRRGFEKHGGHWGGVRKLVQDKEHALELKQNKMPQQMRLKNASKEFPEIAEPYERMNADWEQSK